jgi:hypothetical protein
VHVNLIGQIFSTLINGGHVQKHVHDVINTIFIRL